MTVTKGKQKFAFPSSGNNSDTESLHLVDNASSSDAESLHNAPLAQPPFFRLPQKNAKPEELSSLKKGAGRKKLRRYNNRCLLQTLAEEDETEDVVIVMESYQSPFAKLLQDEDALEFWNMFIHKSEEEQTRIIGDFTHRKSGVEQPSTKAKPFSRISPKIRRTIRVRKNLPLELVKQSEDDLIEFFKNTPRQVYAKFPPTYFKRLLLHAVAQYHGLQSLGMIENGNKKVEIFNTMANWIPAECFLTDFIAQLRS